jgi:hypothetical protein
MTTVILTTIGILLASAAALMVAFYGGDAFTSSAVQADAARLVVEGDQILKAIDSYTMQEGRLPGDQAGLSSDGVSTALMQKKFLSSMPKGYDNPWIIDYPNEMIRVDVGSATDEKAKAICVAARKQIKMADPETFYKCDGSDSPMGQLSAIEPCCIW